MATREMTKEELRAHLDAAPYLGWDSQHGYTFTANVPGGILIGASPRHVKDDEPNLLVVLHLTSIKFVPGLMVDDEGDIVELVPEL